MNKLGLFGAAAVATALCFSSDARATGDGDVSGAALDLVVAGTNTGNGGSFVTKAVKDALGWTSSQWLYYFSYSTLSAARWYEAITAGTNLVEVDNINDVDAGQIIAINATGSYTGHAAVIIGEPIDITPPSGFYTPYVTGTKQWALPIADSTGSEHGQNASYPDSRRVSGVFTANIPGTAYLRLYSDATTGEILSYSWSVTSTNDANVFDQSERPFAIGELTVSP
ncbi:hypothetical protein [Polyangium sorediatum]|uniref:Peptidase C51 domain-containing protein n=1 Tax=Polyangium sorediatum TaxID=889274 RepID=A0ABT6P0A1_9BACT|nr:hypothetical protein [Polyangium sorediatum]MDI1433715.1 hypothetical protein [Polyangium sorediatum]